MPAHESIHEYYLHQHRNIENYLELCLIHPEIELVHELRLSIKKLRAFHKLAEHLFLNNTDEHIHIKNRVRKLYIVAGKLRDTQVQIHMLTLFEEQTGVIHTEFKEWLQRMEKKQILRFNKKPHQVILHATAQSTHHKIGNQLALANDETILTGARNVLEELFLNAQNLSSGNMNDRNLHRLRTITKRMKYILSIIHHSYPDYTFEAVPVGSLREIEAIAGHWHDNLVRIEMLDKFISKVKFADESEKFKYQKLYYACRSELDISSGETFLIVQKAFGFKIMNYKPER
jgi:CHAD domain-containing protein